MADIKWSSFPSTTGTTAGDSVVGLHSGANERFLVSSTPSASGIAVWDANSNLSANSTINGYATTATAAGTTTLTVASKYQQYFTGSTTQTVVMPVTSTLVLGQSYRIVNNGSGNITINASDSSLILLVLPETTVIVTCLSIVVTTNAAWDAQYTLDSLAPSLNNTQYTYTGNTIDSPTIGFFYTSVTILGTYYPNLLTGQVISLSLTGPTTINLGNLAYSYGNINVSWTSTTSFIASSLFFINGTFVLTTPLLTTFSFPALLASSNSITLTNVNSLTTFSLPSYLVCGNLITITSAASLTTFSMPAMILNSGMTGTANALTTLTLTNLVTIVGTYSLTANALTTLSMPALTTISTNFAPAGTSLATVNMPLLTSVGGTFSPTLAALTSLTLTNLQTVTGAFGLTAATLTTLSMPALTTLGAGFAPVCASATTVTLTLLANITGAVAASFAALTTLSFPALLSVSSTWTITAANLVTFSMNSGLLSIGGNFTMTGMKLNQASVDGILVSLAALNGTGGTTAYSSHTVNLSGGTSSTPSSTGLTAKATLVARGCTVTTN